MLNGPSKPGPAAPSRVLVLHGWQLVVDLIGLTLTHGAFEVRVAPGLAAAHAAAARWHPHLAIVDMDHPDGEALLRELVARDRPPGPRTAVMGLTRRGDLQARLEAFGLGVDDILTAPFSPEELLARSLVLARRAGGADPVVIPTITVGDIRIDILAREVRMGGTTIRLSGIEQSLLYLLASRRGEVLSRNDILDAIWGEFFVAGSNVVDRHIRALRRKLDDDHRHPRFIATVPGEGYRFVPPGGGVEPASRGRTPAGRSTAPTARAPRPHARWSRRSGGGPILLGHTPRGPRPSHPEAP